MLGIGGLATPVEIRELMTAREKLLIHFNGPTSRHPTGYPADLHDALASPAWRMCFSTIGLTDPPWPEAASPGQATSLGMVGLIADLTPETRVIRVCNSDAGSDGRAHELTAGEEPTRSACRRSIDEAVERHNEWLVADVTFVGVFAWPHPIVHAGGQQQFLGLDQIVQDFPGERVFTAANGSFHEYDRAVGAWIPRVYTDIMKA